MASLKREEEFKVNRARYENMQHGFKFAFWTALIPSGGVFIIMGLYYFIRALALLAGATMVIGQKIANDITGGSETTGLGYKVPYLYMGFLFLIALLSFLGFFFKVKKPHYVTLGLYIAGAVYGLIALILGSVNVFFGLYLIAYGAFGVWLCDYIFRLHKEHDYLSL